MSTNEARFRSITYAFVVWAVYFYFLFIFQQKIEIFGGVWKYRAFVCVISVVMWWSTRGLIKNSQPKVKTETKTVTEKDYINKTVTIGMRNDLMTLKECTTKNVTTDDELRDAREAMKRCRSRLRSIERDHVGVDFRYDEDIEEIYE